MSREALRPIAIGFRVPGYPSDQGPPDLPPFASRVLRARTPLKLSIGDMLSCRVAECLQLLTVTGTVVHCLIYLSGYLGTYLGIECNERGTNASWRMELIGLLSQAQFLALISWWPFGIVHRIVLLGHRRGPLFLSAVSCTLKPQLLDLPTTVHRDWLFILLSI
jgi:hypothetical protein